MLTEQSKPQYSESFFAGSPSTIEYLPSWLIKANFKRTDSDLIATSSDKSQEIIFIDFFSNYDLPSLITENGLIMNGSLLSHLAGPRIIGQYVQAENIETLSIGEVSTIKGKVEATRIDGTTVELKIKDPVFQGDTIETIDDGNVGLVFIDKTTLSLSEGGKMVLDELIYDPSTGNGSMVVDMVEGAFSFISGEVAKTGPDAMQLKTPVVTMGIRGTTVAGKAAIEGNENSFTLLQDADGGVGQISVSNEGGTQVLSQVGATTVVSSFQSAPPAPIILSAAQIQANYGTALNVLPPTPAVAPQPQSAPEPEAEQEESQEEVTEEEVSEGEVSEEVSEEGEEGSNEDGDSEAGEEGPPEGEDGIEGEEEGLPEGEEGIEGEDGPPEGEESNLEGEGGSPEGEGVPIEDGDPQEGEAPLAAEGGDPEGPQGPSSEQDVAAREAFDQAMADGASPEEAMAAAAGAAGFDGPVPGGPGDGLDGPGDLTSGGPGPGGLEELGGAIGSGPDEGPVGLLASPGSFGGAIGAPPGDPFNNSSNFGMPGAFAGAPVSFAEPLGGAGTYGDPFGGPGSFGSPFGPSTGFGDSQAGGLLGQFSPMESFIPGSGGGFGESFEYISDDTFVEQFFFFDDPSLYDDFIPPEELSKNSDDSSNSNQILTGDSNANVLVGGSADDTIDGGLGVDTLTGGEGSDTFILSDFGDTITDFTTSDKIEINWLFDPPVSTYNVTRSSFYTFESSSILGALTWISEPSSSSQNLTETESNGSFGSAQVINRSSFKISTNNEVGNDAYPWVNIGSGYINNGIDIFKVNLQDGETLVVDVDYGDSYGINFDSYVTVYDSSLSSVAENDNSLVSQGGTGSSGSLDSYVEYTSSSSESFYILLEDAPKNSNSSTRGDYEINLSIIPTAKSTGLGTSSTSSVGGNNELPYVFNITENTSNYLSNSFKSGLISSIRRTDSTTGNGSEVFIVAGDGANSAIWMWDDLSEGYGISNNELSFVAHLENFDNDELTSSQISFTS